MTWTSPAVVRRRSPERMSAPAVRGAESVLLHVLLKDVPEIVVNDLTQRVGMQSIDDFLGFFSTSNFEAEMKAYTDSFQDIPILV